ncbi:MAG: GTP cyclohydrolase I FolE2 [Desulfurococcaceae archaeon]|nr:GTP cyclohydrolase I FolE2 [Desulfurococcaceae archaeon]
MERNSALPDVHRVKPLLPIHIDDVCIKGLRIKLCKDNGEDSECSLAVIDVCTDLDKGFRGVHISRSIEALLNVFNKFTYTSLLDIQYKLKIICKELLARHEYSYKASSRLSFEDVKNFDTAPLTLIIASEVSRDGFEKYYLKVVGKGSTVCPCAQQVYAFIEKLGLINAPSHMQRASITLYVSSSKPIDVNVDELLDIVVTSFSAPMKTLLKRVDEYRLVKEAFSNPKFAEDVARETIHRAYRVFRDKLSRDSKIGVKVVSYESIHPYNLSVKIVQTVENLDKMFSQ